MRLNRLAGSLVLAGVFAASSARADAPAWMHNLVNAALPAHDEKTSAVLLYSEDVLTVQNNGKLKHLERRAYKILRPEGSDYGVLRADMSSETKVVSMHGWCIPAQGKDYEVKDKEAIEMALPAVPGSELITDVRAKVVKIPAADVGNIVGYEYEKEMRPMVLQDGWYFQGSYPTREEHYTLQLPAGWEYKAAWLNHGLWRPLSLRSDPVSVRRPRIGCS